MTSLEAILLLIGSFSLMVGFIWLSVAARRNRK